MLQLLRDFENRPVALTLNGPRGPARVAQPGAVWLSKATGQPVIPFHLESDRHWTLPSWDRTQIPEPRARVALVFAEPFMVRDASDEQLDEWNRRLQSSLVERERKFWKYSRSGCIEIVDL